MLNFIVSVDGKDYQVTRFAGETRNYIRRASGNRPIVKSAATHAAVVAAAIAAGKIPPECVDGCPAGQRCAACVVEAR